MHLRTTKKKIWYGSEKEEITDSTRTPRGNEYCHQKWKLLERIQSTPTYFYRAILKCSHLLQKSLKLAKSHMVSAEKINDSTL